MLNKYAAEVAGILVSATILLGVFSGMAKGLETAGTVPDDENTEENAETEKEAEIGETSQTVEPEEGETGPDADDEPPYILRSHTLKGGDGVHGEYASGYGDGTFGVNDSVTRAQAAVMLYRVIDRPGGERMEFEDVPAGSWYADALEYLGAVGVVRSDDGRARPDMPVTRGEFAAMIVRLMAGEGFEEAEGAPFDDVPEDSPWRREIAYAASKGWIYGNENGKFRPDSDLTRAEAVTVINRLLGAAPDREYLKRAYFSPFSDVNGDHWAYYDVIEAAIPHTHEGSASGKWTSGDLSALEKPQGKYFEGLDYFYVGEDGRPVKNGYAGGLYFGADGMFTSGDATLDGYVKDVLASVATAQMTDMEKLRAAYNYTRDSFSYLRRNYYEVGDTSWANQEALTMFTTKMGNCYCYSSVFYSLARQLGFDAVLISGKVNNTNPIPHAWVEIEEDGKMYMYDAELEMAQRKKGNIYDFFHMSVDATPWSYWR